MAEPGMQPMSETELAQNPGVLKAAAWHGAEVVRWTVRVSPATSYLLPVSLRRILLRLSGLRIGTQVTGLRQCVFQTKRVTIGDGSFVNAGCWFEGSGQVDIGRDVFLGPQVMIITSAHEIDPDASVRRMPTAGKVRIGDRCWLGARAMIMPGVTIGEGTVIGAGSVVTRDCDPGARYVGVPARRVR